MLYCIARRGERIGVIVSDEVFINTGIEAVIGYPSYWREGRGWGVGRDRHDKEGTVVERGKGGEGKEGGSQLGEVTFLCCNNFLWENRFYYCLVSKQPSWILAVTRPYRKHVHLPTLTALLTDSQVYVLTHDEISKS